MVPQVKERGKNYKENNTSRAEYSCLKLEHLLLIKLIFKLSKNRVREIQKKIDGGLNSWKRVGEETVPSSSAPWGTTEWENSSLEKDKLLCPE